MSGFKTAAGYYVSEWNGNSLNDGTDPLTPYAHLADVPSDTANFTLVGTGFYKGTWSGNRKIICDGFVVIDLNGGSQAFGGSSLPQDGFYLKNGSVLPNTGVFQNCILENTVHLMGRTNAQTLGNIILPAISGSYEATNGSIFWNNIILEDITVSSGLGVSFNANFVDKSVRLTFSSFSTTFINNCYNGIISYLGTDYELKKLVDGSVRPDANPLIADIISVFPNVYTQNNFAGDPKFIDVLSRTVESDSDLLKKSNVSGFIGKVRPAKKIAVNAIDPNISISSTDIDTTTTPANWRIQSPATEGEIIITWKLSDIISEVQKIFFDAILSFDGSSSGGSIDNNNVPDIWPTSYSPTTNPDMTPNRLNYALRTSQSVAMPTLDSQWDNDSSTLGTTPGDFYIQEFNTKPTISDVLGSKYGNGNEAGFGGTTNGINARWAQAKIRLTNNRAF
jgi:hypothetical protein